jgi:monoamine oxidase
MDNRGLTRRALIERLSVIGGAGLMMAGMEAFGYGIASARPAPPVLQGSAKGKKIIVLGAGVAGLATAYEAGKAGYEVQVIEARSFAGGRAQTARKGVTITELGGETQTCDFDDGLYINHGPWRIPFHHRSTLHYAKQFAVPLEVFVNDNDAAYLFFENGVGPLKAKAVRKAQIAADARGHAAEMLAKVAKKGGLDDQVTAADRDQLIAYLITDGYLSPKDLAYTGAEGRGWDIEPGAGTDPGPGKPSTPYSMVDVLHSGAWRTLASVSQFEQQRTMFQPVGGMDQIAKAMESRVQPAIRYSTVVEKINQGPGGVEVFIVGANGQKSSIKADYCVCTIPLSVLRSIEMQVQPRFKQAISAPSYGPVGKIGLQMKRRFWEDDDHIYGGHVYTDNPDIMSISFPSTGWHGQKGVLLGYYQFGANAAKVSAKTPAERAAFAVAFGQKVMPQYAENFETAFSVAWHRVKYNLGGWVEWNETTRKDDYPILSEPDGRIYLAGEHVSYITGWQAGAIESAWQQLEKLHRRVQAA